MSTSSVLTCLTASTGFPSRNAFAIRFKLCLLMLLLLLTEVWNADTAALQGAPRHQHCLSWMIRQYLQRRTHFTKHVSSCWLGLSALQKPVFQSVCTITTSADVQGAAWSSTIPYIVDLRQPVTSVGSRQTSVHHTRDLVVCSFCHALIWHPRICCGGSQGLEPTAGAHSSTGNS